MFTLIKRLAVWIGDNLLGHAIIESAKGAFTTGSQKLTEEAMNKLTRKDLLLGVIFARFGTVTHLLTAQEIAEGIKKFNRFYASLAREEKDLFERLFYRDVLDAIQEFLKGTVDQTAPDTRFRIKDLTQDELHQIYLAIVGLSGRKEIRLEMDRLHQMSSMTKVKNLARKGGEGLNELLEGFKAGWRGDC